MPLLSSAALAASKLAERLLGSAISRAMSKGESPKSDGVRPALALIAGPTASGKSDLAVRLALELAKRGRRGVVVNTDSAQVYADLAVLSARPDEEEMRGIEHRLFGAWDGADACSAAGWASAAKREIADIHADGAIPILVGGTGLYIRTLLDGIAPIPEIAPAIRAEVRSMPTQAAYAALENEDSERAALLHPADSTRIARALEVIRSTGRPLAHWHKKQEGGIGDAVSLHPVLILPPREILYPRCDARFAAMLEQGAIEEVTALLERQLSPELPVMRAIGISEITAMLRGDIDRKEAISIGAQATRNYAKRQFTWFRRQSPQDWPRHDTHDCDIPNYFEILLRS